MPTLERQILAALSATDYRPVNQQDLAQLLHITKKSRGDFRTALESLLESGQARRGSDGRLRAQMKSGLISGTIRRTSTGAGFLIAHAKPGSERGQDVYIAAADLRDAHTGDEVLVQLLKGPPRPDGKLRGRVVEVVSRATRIFVGTYFEHDDAGWVRVDGTTLQDPIYVGDPGAKGAQSQDKVVIEMLRFPSHAREGEAVVTKVLGARGAPGVDTQSIIHEFSLPDEFSEEVLQSAHLQAEQFDETNLAGRHDLTGQTIVTIDPADARDFDDAISLELNARGHWVLGVHIADVAHFVPVDSPLDREAARRGTSVYLPDRVLPMLPEIISNGLASLQEGRVRFTKSAIIEFTPTGTPVHTEFYNSAIRVTRRFAYEEVLPIIQSPTRPHPRVTPEVRELLERMYSLAMLLRQRRFQRGALELSLPEVKIDFDKEHRVTGAHLAPHDASHEIIEEFMLAANVAVATALDDRSLPFLRRVHEEPDFRKLKTLAEFVGALGFPLPRAQSREDLQNLLETVRGTPQAHAVNYAFLRSLKQARYSPDALGHYALAEENYCHFTSPIRRYPDLTIHRLVGELVAAGKVENYPGVVELTVLGESCSFTERRAEQAERELIKVKLLTYLLNRIGDKFDAVITGVAEYGFFCQAVEVPAEGMVHITTLDDDFYTYDAKAQMLSGRQTGHAFRLGDRVQVVVAKIDLDRRQLDYRLADSQSGRILQRDRSATQGRSGPVSNRERRGSKSSPEARAVGTPTGSPRKSRNAGSRTTSQHQGFGPSGKRSQHKKKGKRKKRK